MWNDECFLRWFAHAFASALAVGAFVGAIAMLLYEPGATATVTDVRELFAGMRP